MADADRKATLRNPLCGDEITVYLKLSDEGSVSKVSFVGQCCSICTASASMMTGQFHFLPPQDTALIVEDFIETFSDTKKPLRIANDLAALSGVREFPSRIRCATLPFEALREALRTERVKGEE